MKHFLVLFGSLLLVIALSIAFFPTMNARALPEYSAQTGEPCATCHVSPSGGGPRAPRGQAWVASGKPGAVPDTIQALELLGVELTVDPAYYTVTDLQTKEADALQVTSSRSQRLYRWLNQYEGN